MPSQIRIVMETGEVQALLDDSLTGKAIGASLPLEGTVNRWGEEIYFTVPVKVAEAPDARQDMAVGELGYWPVGAAFCIFFGPTPVSDGLSPRAYSNVNLCGRIIGEEEEFKSLLGATKDGQSIRVLPV